MVAINVALPGAQRNSDLSEVARLRVILNATRGEICGYSIFFFYDFSLSVELAPRNHCQFK